MSEQLYNIVTSSSDITYSDVALIAPDDGINTFDRKWKHIKTFTYNASTSTGDYFKDIIYTADVSYPMYCLFHITGTITRDITDDAVFYYFVNSLPRTDQLTLIPVEPHQSEVSFDIVNITDKDTTSYNYYRVWIATCDKDFNKVVANSTINMKVDYYCL